MDVEDGDRSVAEVAVALGGVLFFLFEKKERKKGRERERKKEKDEDGRRKRKKSLKALLRSACAEGGD